MAIVINGSGTITGISVGGLPDDIVDSGMMADNSIDSDTYVDASIDNAHLADDAVGVAELSATGTASSSTFLRGDNAWAAAGGDNTPSFHVTLSGNQTLANSTNEKILWDTETWDTDSAFASNKFTVPSGEGGKYLFVYHIYLDNVADQTNGRVHFYLNGSDDNFGCNHNKVGGQTNLRLTGTNIKNLSAGDYVEIYAYNSSYSFDSGLGSRQIYANQSWFSGIKLIGV